MQCNLEASKIHFHQWCSKEFWSKNQWYNTISALSVNSVTHTMWAFELLTTKSLCLLLINWHVTDDITVIGPQRWFCSNFDISNLPWSISFGPNVPWPSLISVYTTSNSAPARDLKKNWPALVCIILPLSPQILLPFWCLGGIYIFNFWRCFFAGHQK